MCSTISSVASSFLLALRLPDPPQTAAGLTVTGPSKGRYRFAVASRFAPLTLACPELPF